MIATLRPKAAGLEAVAAIGWMVDADLPGVVAVDVAAHDRPWGGLEIARRLGHPSTIGMVAGVDGRVVGFALYTLARNEIEVIRFAVQPECRRRGVGARMMASLVGKLTALSYERLAFEVRETDDLAVAFLAACGLRASLTRRRFASPEEDGYRFVYHV
jgi:ribosomal protein S18 acetylase RimI-like enzyme